ncbi:MAG: YncE family protein [Bacteroidetes bacterium]|nr:YncE family protein [Bacteroidota bacterium]
MNRISISSVAKFRKGFMAGCAVLLLPFFFGACKKGESNDTPKERVGLVYVAEEESGSVSVIHSGTNEVVRSISISEPGTTMPLMPHNVQVAPNGKSVWVSAMAHHMGMVEQVVVLDPNRGDSVLKRINIGTSQHLAHVVLDDSSRYAYVVAGDASQVVKIDAQTFEVDTRFILGGGHNPHGLRYHDGFLYVASMGTKSLTIIDVTNGKVKDVFLGGSAVQTAIAPNGKYVYVTLFDTKEVVKYDIQNKTITRIPLPPGALGPIQLYPSPDGQYMFVCDQGELSNPSNKVYVLDLNNNKAVQTFIVGSGAHGVVLSDDGVLAFVTNSFSNSVSVIDLAKQTVRKTISVGESPNGISYRAL